MRTLTTVVAALGAAAALAAPAAAQTGGPTITTIGHGTQTTMGNDRSAVVVTCAVMSPSALGTGVADCYLRGVHDGVVYRVGDRDALPGPLDANVGATLSVPEQPYEVCVRGRSVDRDGTYYETPLYCRPVTRLT